jgi:hypothetical protein
MINNAAKIARRRGAGESCGSGWESDDDEDTLITLRGTFFVSCVLDRQAI